MTDDNRPVGTAMADAAARSGRGLRVVIAKAGLDGHERGAKVVARALRDAGHEVVYTGRRSTPEQLVATALEEDADVIGISVLSGAHLSLFKRTAELLQDRGASDIVLIGGGIIPDEDIPALTAMGVERIFTPGAATADIVQWLSDRFWPPATDG